MSATLSWNSPAPWPLRAGVGVAVLTVHVLVVGAILLSKSEPLPVEPVKVVSVRFVQIAPQIQTAPTPPKPEPVPPKPVPPKPLPRPVPKVPTPEEPKPLSDTALSVPPPAPPVQAPPPAPTPLAAPVAEKAAAPAAPPAPPSDQPRAMSGAEYIRPPELEYPRLSQQLGEHGEGLVAIVINTDGTIRSAQISKSSGFERLDSAALRAVKKALFKSPSDNGVPYVGSAFVPFAFNLPK
jgi:protein TonB